MNKIVFFLVLFSTLTTISAQQDLIIKDSISLKADRFLGIDSFGAIYYSKGDIFYKKWNDHEWQFGDFILGKLTSVSIRNPLKIILFYESSNTVVLVDKYLSEIKRINFNTIADFKAVTRVSAANDNNLWIFDSNTQLLEVFDTDSDKTLATTQPINEIPIVQRGNFNYCWILTPTKLFRYNIYGSLLDTIENKEFLDIKIINDDLIMHKDDGIYYLSIAHQEIEKINLPQIPVKQFYVTNEILYIYHQSKIYSFELIPQKK
ncbi:hypothetical protein [Aquimarina sp. RZ0]|uniref:hypothetical protein n=1 Tax=Aquimarina sp. RZ0 TaxID=2607730 RepID=UPI0011F21C47|nr:hypothetical protein [Aquimarina sp. RZ0]KAA1244572.1 hypothetical protein F0000_15730 [Aquimarina sp. RZ0]